MNKYFTTRSINRPWSVLREGTIIYCDDNRRSITMMYNKFPDATPITRQQALQLVRQERRQLQYGNICAGYPHTSYVYPYWWAMGRAIDATDNTGCIVIR